MNVYTGGYGWDYRFKINVEEEWVARYSSLNADEANDAAVDSSGNIYVTGKYTGESDTDFLTVKYDSSDTHSGMPHLMQEGMIKEWR